MTLTSTATLKPFDGDVTTTYSPKVHELKCGEYWESWYESIPMAIRAMKLWNTISGTEVKPIAGTPEEMEHWEEKDLRAQMNMGQHLSPSAKEDQN